MTEPTGHEGKDRPHGVAAAVVRHFTLRRNVAIIIVSLCLAIIGAVFSPLWLIAACLAVSVGTLLTIAATIVPIPRPYRHLRAKMAKAHQRATQHPILLRYLHDGMANTAHELDSVIGGRLSFRVWQVPELSIHAMNLVNKRCTLIFPLRSSEALLTPDAGTAADYYNAMVAASRRLQQAGGLGVVRIFVLSRSDDVSPRLLQFIRKHIGDKVQVRIVFEDELPHKPLQVDELDFGYYETTDGHEWIMLLRSAEEPGTVRITDYLVDTDPDTIRYYRRFSDDIMKISRSFDEFMALLTQPVNGDLWPIYFAERGYEMFPPHGLSGEDADYIVESAVASLSDPLQSSVLILGFTPKLIKGLLSHPIGRVESIDHSQSKPVELADKVTFHTGNWLEMQPARKYDAIIFDEALNNLSRLQLSLFFPRIREVLKPGGHIVGRVMGRFDDETSQKYLDRTAWEAVEDLRRVGGATHEDFASLIICLLHSKHLAFSPTALLVDCGRWNSTLQSLRDADRISEDEYRLWRLHFNFKLLSPDLDILVRDARQSNCSPLEVRAVRGDYITRCRDTSEFYRIVNFERVPDGTPV